MEVSSKKTVITLKLCEGYMDCLSCSFVIYTVSKEEAGAGTFEMNAVFQSSVLAETINKLY